MECAFRAHIAADVLMLQKGYWSCSYFMLFCYLFILNKHCRFLKAWERRDTWWLS